MPLRLKPSLPALGVASLLAAGTNAYGQVVFTSVNGGSGTLIATNTTLSVSLPVGFSTPVLTLLASSGSGEGGYLKFLGNGGSNQPVGATNKASLLAASTIINGASVFASSTAYIWAGFATTDWGAFNATGTQRGYVGFKFMSNLGSQPTLYGWLDIEINRGPSPTIKLFGYAYEGTPGVPITTPIPEPSAAALVLGAASLLALRQRRRKAA